ncbi:alpha-2,8-sialyltransferase 8F-like [Lithobates pipiens]
MVRRYPWKVILILNTLVICYVFYQSQQSQPEPGHDRSRKREATQPAANCSRLKSVILHSTLKILKKDVFFKSVRALQRCWIEKPSNHKLLQTNFQTCCNASYSLVMTQENTLLGQVIQYEPQNKKLRNVTESLHSLLPEKSPFKKPLKHCVVVGNGGILDSSFCGSEIDRADFVFRLNFPPMNRSEDVGTKTDLVYANPSILLTQFNSLRESRISFINMVKEYPSSFILLPAFSFSGFTEVSFRTLYTMEDLDLKSKVVFFNPDYLRKLNAYWRLAGLRFRRLSSGLVMVSVAAEICEKVTLYGFWPYSEDLDGIWIPHHYFDNERPKPEFYSLPDEFYQYLKIHAQGSVRLHLGHC